MLRANRPALLALVLGVVCLAALGGATQAFAHAQLLGTSPTSGSTVAAQPTEVVFKFNQAVGGTLGAVRVYDAQGNEVDNLDVSHPEGREHWMGVGLKPHLPDGTYTATYRVISADTHIVYGGMVFNIGHPGAAPRFTVAGLIGRNETRRGHDRRVRRRAVSRLRLDRTDARRARLSGARLAARSRGGRRRRAGLASGVGGVRPAPAALLIAAVVLGVVASVLGFLLQGASAAGVSLWASLKGAVLEDTLDSRFGQVWGARAIDWLVLGALLRGPGRRTRHDPRAPSRPAGRRRSGASSRPAALGSRPGWRRRPLSGVTPALSGHASVQSPIWAFFPSDVLHVLAASVWVGGIACLLLALPAATRRLRALRAKPPVARNARALLAARAGRRDHDRG